MTTKKIFFFRAPYLTVKTLKRMHMDMDHGSHAEMTAECKRIGCPKKTIEDRITKVIQECIACLHKGPNFTKGKLQKNESLFNTNVFIQQRRVTNDRYYTHLFSIQCIKTGLTTARYVNMENYRSKSDIVQGSHRLLDLWWVRTDLHSLQKCKIIPQIKLTVYRISGL